MAGEMVLLPGSRREPVPGAQRVGPVDAQTVITTNVVLRRQRDEPGSGADPDDVARVEALARRIRPAGGHGFRGGRRRWRE